MALILTERCTVIICEGDINSFDLPKEEFYGKNDRVISIEMFEHMKNYELLLEKVSNWLKPEGKVGTKQYATVDLETTQYLPLTLIWLTSTALYGLHSGPLAVAHPILSYPILRLPY